jgi:electron transport complex protein RnfC
MVERASELVDGLKILMKTLGVNNGYVGIEENKPDAVEAGRSAIS